MRFVECCSGNVPRLGVVHNELVFDVQALNPSLPDGMLAFIQAGASA